MDHRSWSARKRETRAASAGGGRTAMRVSPTEPGPGDTPACIPVDAPVPWPGERGHDIEPVRPPIVVRPVTPRPSGVLHLDPEVLLADFGAHGERAPVPGGAVHNRVGRQFFSTICMSHETAVSPRGSDGSVR